MMPFCVSVFILTPPTKSQKNLRKNKPQKPAQTPSMVAQGRGGQRTKASRRATRSYSQTLAKTATKRAHSCQMKTPMFTWKLLRVLKGGRERFESDGGGKARPGKLQTSRKRVCEKRKNDSQCRASSVYVADEIGTSSLNSKVKEGWVEEKKGDLSGVGRR